MPRAKPAIGFLPRAADLDTRDLDIAPGALEELLAVSPPEWRKEFEQIGTYLAEVGERVPQALRAELRDALARTEAA